MEAVVEISIEVVMEAVEEAILEEEIAVAIELSLPGGITNFSRQRWWQRWR